MHGSLRYAGLVRAGDKAGLRQLFLDERAEDLYACFVDMEEWLADEEQERLDKATDKLLPGGEFSRLLREKPALKSPVARRTRRHLSRLKKRLGLA